MRKKTPRTRDPGSTEVEGNIYDSLRPAVDELVDSVNQLNRTSAEFLKTDTETALTFASIASQTEDVSKRERNRQNARRGYDTVLRLSARVPLSYEDEQFLSERMGRLKLELQRLGEVF
jgi:hypothetical protein